MQSEFKSLILKYKLLSIAALFMAVGIIFYLNRTYAISGNKVNVVVCNSNDVDSIYAINDSVVLPVLYQHVPDLSRLHYKVRMRKFVDMMLPSVLMASEKMNRKREKILSINAMVNKGVASILDSLYLQEIKMDYKTDNVNDIIKRLHPHQPSIVIAQAAIESGWATSRFCREGNNIFGIWSYNKSEKRMKASESRGDSNVYLRRYDSLFESVYDYLETIAHANAYKEFREARLNSDNPYRLIWYLSNYSEKRYEYVHMLRNVMEFNDLHEYDSYQLAKIKRKDKVWQALLD
jgi:Bax protein